MLEFGIVMQDVAVFDELSVEENIDYFCGLYINDKNKRKQYVDEAIAFVGLEDFRKFKPKKLSGGLLRRLNIACGIAHKPELIILDEPTVAVDPQSRNKILEGITELNKKGATIIYTSHYMEEVEQICTHILIMDKGKNVTEGTAEELKRSIRNTENIIVYIKNLDDAHVKAINNINHVYDVYYIDSADEWNKVMSGDFIRYVHELHEKGKIRHIGLSTHNPVIGKLAVQTGFIEMILFSINPAFDMRPATEDLDTMWSGYDDKYAGIDPERAEFYRMCDENNVGLTVMKGFFGGALLDKDRSPFGVAFTPVQLIHYALTRPGVASILCGYDTKEQVDAAVSYENATDDEKDYASVIATAPLHSYKGQCTYCGHCICSKQSKNSDCVRQL